MRIFRFCVNLLLLASLQLSALSDPLVVAHRGGRSLGPGNRLPTIRKALELNVDAIEVDIHQSKDGHLMVAHDLTLERHFGVTGRIDKMTLSELRAVGVPTLVDVANVVNGRCRLVIEIKHPKDGTRHLGIEQRLVDFLKQHHLLESSIVISFYADSLKRFHQLAPKVNKGFLFSKTPGNLRRLKRELGLSYLGPRNTLVTPSFIRRAHRLDLKVNPWTVNGRQKLRRFVGLDCDAITTDDPHYLVEILRGGWFVESHKPKIGHR